MDIEVFRTFFMWCTIINVGLLVVAFLMCASAGDWIYRMHGRWFPISKESFHVVIYSILAAFKTLVILFNVVPYVALVIMG
ncbi:MAG: hypothetical protein JW888_06155 [Pirellulales bacterium]|nr:hypothetical protein [Pirellulales bacterium]